MKVLGLDPGSRIAGFGCLQRSAAAKKTPLGFEVLTAGVFRLDERAELSLRLGQIHEALHELIRELNPDAVVLERAFYGANISTAIKLGEVRGAMIAAVRRQGITLVEATPAEIKHMVAGNGRADKNQVELAIKTYLGFDRGQLPHDATDALAIALYGALKLQSPTGRIPA